MSVVKRSRHRYRPKKYNVTCATEIQGRWKLKVRSVVNLPLVKIRFYVMFKNMCYCKICAQITHVIRHDKISAKNDSSRRLSLRSKMDTSSRCNTKMQHNERMHVVKHQSLPMSVNHPKFNFSGTPHTSMFSTQIFKMRLTRWFWKRFLQTITNLSSKNNEKKKKTIKRITSSIVVESLISHTNYVI